MDYAIIKLGGKQYRVRDGETLVVDRVATDEGQTLTPAVLLGDSGVTVTARVLAHERGPKIRIGKYKARVGYKRHTGFRAATSRIEISLGGAGRSKAAPKASPEQEAPAPDERPDGLPDGYEDMTVAQISEAAPAWDRQEVEMALAYEREHATRKGALAALESALEKEES